MKALIFAAGLGTRLKPYTETMPKAMVPINGKPMLWHQVQRLKAAGVDSLVINVHHFADQIIDYVQSQDCFGMQVQFSDERGCLLDTGGGLLHARSFLEGEGEPFLIHNVDIFSNLDLGAFIADGLGAGTVAKLLVSDRNSSRKLLFKADRELCGWKNLKTGELRGPAADAVASAASRAASGMVAPASAEASALPALNELAFGGVHLVSPSIFKVFDAINAQYKSAGKEAPFIGSFGIIDFYLAACRNNRISAYIQPGLTLIDAGKPEALQHCSELL